MSEGRYTFHSRLFAPLATSIVSRELQIHVFHRPLKPVISSYSESKVTFDRGIPTKSLNFSLSQLVLAPSCLTQGDFIYILQISYSEASRLIFDDSSS
ncbi:uncharacterized protein RSE6_01590 [Rhynchosporium secalis]|uniref:Uncharacterized protein n=1 Tax=Rhynchosporium secalis TaxID=38038 RepID=A0A1E1LY82_RHYSE|nr:uncharacterized protein RSE6_01590 [Rhynchosporium secalis]